MNLRFTAGNGLTTVRIPLTDDFGVSFSRSLPAHGAPSRDLRILSETWSQNADSVTILVSGVANHEYELALAGTAGVQRVEGAELVDSHRLRFRIPNGEGYQHHSVKITLGSGARAAHAQ